MFNLDEISFLQLELFLRVARYRNLTRVADSMYLSPSSVTRKIQKLEQILDQTLFLRTNRGLTLTENGRLLYQVLEPAFQNVNAILSNNKKGSTESNRVIRIAIVNINEVYSECTTVIRRFQHEYPDIDTDIQITDLPSLREGLLNGTYDCAFTYRNSVADLNNTNLYDFRKMHSYFAISPQSDAINNGTLYYDKLNEHDLCTFAAEQAFGGQERSLRICDTYGFHPKCLRSIDEGHELLNIIKEETAYLFIVGIGFKIRFGDQICLFPIQLSSSEEVYISFAWQPQRCDDVLHKLILTISEYRHSEYRETIAAFEND